MIHVARFWPLATKTGPSSTVYSFGALVDDGVGGGPVALSGSQGEFSGKLAIVRIAQEPSHASRLVEPVLVAAAPVSKVRDGVDNRVGQRGFGRRDDPCLHGVRRPVVRSGDHDADDHDRCRSDQGETGAHCPPSCRETTINIRW